MIHELIDPKKKANKTNASRNIKTLQENKAVFEDCNFEPSDSENKEAESSSTTFIPPWLRNSLGLNQRNNLSHPTASSESKTAKIIQKNKEPGQNEFYSLKPNAEQDYNKKTTDNFEVTQQNCSEEDNINKGTDNAEEIDAKINREVSVYWDVRRKESESDSNCTNEETKSFVKEDSKIIDTDIMTLADLERVKEDEKKRVKLIKQKSKLRKRNMGNQKLPDLDKASIDFLLEVKARETLDNFMKKDIHTVKSEIKSLEEKVLLISPKNPDSNGSKLNHQELRLLQEIKSQVGNVEEVERLFEHVREFNMREIIKNPILKSKSITEKKREDKEEKSTKEAVQKCNDDGNPPGDKDSLLSTDDENDIKRFSEFLSKNKNLDEKRKCLEEVRNYFEKKRRARMAKRRFMEEEKTKVNPEPEEKEEHSKEKLKLKDFYRGRKSKFALCDEEVVEKAVDETLQKFVEMYHIHVSPTVMGNMKKNILQAMTTDTSDADNSKATETSTVKKLSLDLLNSVNKEAEKPETQSFTEPENSEVSNKESIIHKDMKKKSFKTLIESSGEQILKLAKETEIVENEKLKRLKKEFDSFLHSIKNHFDVTNLKLQRIVIEKEELSVPSKSVQFVYNFTKKSLEPEKPEFWHNHEDSSKIKNQRDSETQTTLETEIIKRNVKVQAFEQKSRCEESLQTDDAICTHQSTQTNDEGISIREIKELTSSDVNPGLYRMVKSKEAGKFYLYPEQVEEGKKDTSKSVNSLIMKEKKVLKKKEMMNILSKEKSKERRVYFKEKEKAKLKKSKRALETIAQVKGVLPQTEKGKIATGNSINCLYFRDLNKKNSESISSKKEIDLTDENISGRLEDGEELGVGDAKEGISKRNISKESHLGCFWFWNGEKITPGCDLKTHVEDLLKEKLKEITNVEACQKDFIINTLSTERQQQSKISQRSLDVKNTNDMSCASNTQDGEMENTAGLTENECLDERNTIEWKKNEDEENGKMLTHLSKKISVKNVATQNSQQGFLSLNLSKLKIQSKMGNSVKRKCNKRNIVIRPAKGKTVNLKKAEDIIRAVEEFRKIRLGFENPKKEKSMDSESTLDGSTFTSGSKNEDDPLSVVLGLKDSPEVEEISNLDFKNRLKNFSNFIDREIQTGEKCDLEDTFSSNQTLGKYKHLELIESVLGRASHKEREDLWNNITDFIKTKIGRDINDEGAREVCIEIEQEMPKYEQGKARHAIMAKGHYAKDEGDVEVEIDLTLDDLEKILRQRQKKNRRRTLYRSSRSKNFLSSSSIQSDLAKDDFRRYQKYLHRFAVLGEGFAQNKEMKAFLEK